jgi:N-acetylglucosamine kinase-like BadF-type ATPase
MSAYYLGVDIGGTKSHALIADQSGGVVGFGHAGPGKRQGADFNRVGRVLNAITGQALAMAGLDKAQIAGVGLGISDYDWPSQRAPHVEQIETLKLAAPYELVNDAVIGLLAGSAEGWGLCLIAGTGCNCWGLTSDRRVGHVTGFGLRFGEGAGAYELIARAIQAVAAAWRMNGPPTRLTDIFCGLVGAPDANDLLEGLTLKRYHIPPSAAPLVFQVAEAGDTVARDVITWAGRELARLAEAVIHQLGFERETFDVVLAGSLYKGGALLIDPLREALQAVAPGARLVDLNAPPVIGGVLLGMEQAGIERAAIQQARQQLLASSGTTIKQLIAG